MIAKNI